MVILKAKFSLTKLFKYEIHFLDSSHLLRFLNFLSWRCFIFNQTFSAVTSLLLLMSKCRLKIFRTRSLGSEDGWYYPTKKGILSVTNIVHSVYELFRFSSLCLIYHSLSVTRNLHSIHEFFKFSRLRLM